MTGTSAIQVRGAPTGCVLSTALCGYVAGRGRVLGGYGAGAGECSVCPCSRFLPPGPNGGMAVNLSSGGSTVTIDGIAFSGPVFQAAEKNCTPLGGGGGGNPAVPEQQKLALLAYARCMRQHGVSQYTDPQFPSGGGIFGGSVDRQAASSPAYKHAAAVCSERLGSYGPG
jgi:hypothetical protein